MNYCIRTILAVLLGSGIALCAELPSHWSTDLTSALEESGTTGNSVLVYFTASWCSACKLMARTTLANEKVVRALSGIRHVAIDVDEKPELAGRHQVQAVPVFVILSANGREIVRTTGYQPATEFQEWLTDGMEKAKEAVIQQNRFEKEFLEIDQLLASRGKDSQRKAAIRLFDLCSVRDASIGEVAAARLKDLSVDQPGLLLDGLKHPRLSTRIQVANLLRTRLGNAFDVDPWSEAETREKAIAQWRKKLVKADLPGETPPSP